MGDWIATVGKCVNGGVEDTIYLIFFDAAISCF